MQFDVVLVWSLRRSRPSSRNSERLAVKDHFYMPISSYDLPRRIGRRGNILRIPRGARRRTGIRERIANFRITFARMTLVVFEAVEILVAFPARLAAVRFILLNAPNAQVRSIGGRVEDAEGPVFVRLKFLGVVAVLDGKGCQQT